MYVAPESVHAGPVERDLEGRTLGVLSSLLTGSYFGALLASISGAANAHGARPVAVQTQGSEWQDDYKTGPARTPRLGWRSIDAFVVVLDAVSPEVLAQMRDAGKPLVLVSHPEPGSDAPLVLADNRSGACSAVEHLIGHGHRRIAFTGDLALADVRERLEAYVACLRANGIEPDPSLVFPAPDSLERGGRIAGAAMLAAGLPSTAVFAATDYNAFGVMSVLGEHGLSIPADQAVVGFDDMPESPVANPALTTVTQNFGLIGATAVGLISRIMAGEHVGEGRHEVGSTLVVRESCGCPGPVAQAVSGLDRRAPALEAFVAAVTETFAVAQGTPAEHGATAKLAGAGETRAGEARAAEASGRPAAQCGPVLRGVEIAREVGLLFGLARERDLTALELLRLGRLGQEFHRWHPSIGSVRLVTLARHLAGRLEEGAPSDVSARLDLCMQEVAAGVARAGLLEQVRLNEQFQASAWNDYNVSMDLLRSHEQDPRSLQWLARTSASAGVLALWSDGRTGEQLEIVGCYEREGAAPALIGERCLVEDFPPPQLLARSATADGDGVLVLLPVRTPSSDRGLLALLVPPSLASRHTFFQWSAMLSQALDYEAATSSVRQRNAELARSYEREREMADAVRHSEERYALAARAANDGLWDWDLASGAVYYSERWKQMLGYRADAIGTSPQEWLSRVHPDDRAHLMRALSGPDSGAATFELEHRVRTADGDYRWVLCRGLAVPGGAEAPKRIVGSLTDVTERRALEDKLLHQALYDALTGLPNRALFLDRLSQSLAYARREPSHEFAVLWLDLDGFKVVNDSLGHLAGDRLLVAVAERIRGNLREADTAARFGGDEFAVLLHNVSDPNLVEAIVARLQKDLSRPYHLDGHEVVVTASIGIAGSSSAYDKAEDVLRDADIAMYKAKSEGRAGHTTFDASMYAGAISRLQTETALRQAIEEEQLELHYQPIVKLSDGTLQAMEVLVRWRHPERGLVQPSEFLPVAEESGLVVAMGRWVQTEACRQLAEWKAAGLISPELRTSINLSHREFWAPGLLDQVDDVLAGTGVPAAWVTFEITEGVIMHNLPLALKVLGELHGRGLQIHIDDFGTGYSSLEALHRLPIDALKIDRSFVSNLQDDKSVELVRTIVQLGRNLGVDVIAEGIETPAQQHLLGDLGCPLGQGYWFSVPVPAGRLGGMLVAAGALATAPAARAPAAGGTAPDRSGRPLAKAGDRSGTEPQ